MNFTDQSQADWQFLQPIQSIVERADVIVNFAHVVRTLNERYLFRLICVEIHQGGKRAFNSGGQHCFLSDEWLNEQPWKSEIAGCCSELAQLTIGVRKRRHQWQRPA